MWQFLTLMYFFAYKQVYLEFSQVDLFGVSTYSLYLETPKWQYVFLSKITQVSKGNNVLNANASITDGFLLRGTCVTCP
jgi:hypothetical protein